MMVGVKINLKILKKKKFKKNKQNYKNTSYNIKMVLLIKQINCKRKKIMIIIIIMKKKIMKLFLLEKKIEVRQQYLKKIDMIKKINQ